MSQINEADLADNKVEICSVANFFSASRKLSERTFSPWHTAIDTGDKKIDSRINSAMLMWLKSPETPKFDDNIGLSMTSYIDSELLSSLRAAGLKIPRGADILSLQVCFADACKLNRRLKTTASAVTDGLIKFISPEPKGAGMLVDSVIDAIDRGMSMYATWKPYAYGGPGVIAIAAVDPRFAVSARSTIGGNVYRTTEATEEILAGCALAICPGGEDHMMKAAERAAEFVDDTEL